MLLPGGGQQQYCDMSASYSYLQMERIAGTMLPMQCPACEVWTLVAGWLGWAGLVTVSVREMSALPVPWYLPGPLYPGHRLA